MSTDLEKYREDFQVTKKYVYLANAAIAPIPIIVYNKVSEFYKDLLNNGSVSWKNWRIVIDDARERYAKFIGASSPEEVAFTHSTSEGMNIIAHMLSHKGLVMLNDLEYPSTNLAWLNKNHTNLRFVKSRDRKQILIEDIIKVLKNPNLYENKNSRDMVNENEKIKTIVTSHVQFSTGYRQDLESLGSLARQNEQYFVVNATQSLGALHVNVNEYDIDCMVSNGHKWMLSSFGIGNLFIRKRILSDNDISLPTFYSQSGQKIIDDYDLNTKLDFSNSATRFEVGSLPIQNIVALNASLSYLMDIGIDRIEKRILYLTDYLISKINESNFEILSPIENKKNRSGIVVFKPRDKNPAMIVAELESKYNIIVSARGKGIRVSPHFYNNEEDVDKLILAVGKIISK